MANPLPQDVPEPGIYDFTIVDFGLNSVDENVLKLVIDNGDFAGAKVSALLSDREVSDLTRLVGADLEEIARRKTARVSGELDRQIMAQMEHTREWEMWSDLDDRKGVKQFSIRYDVSGFSEPESGSEIEDWFNRQRSKFRR